ncbi:hypothetical protein JB92DRAFT_2557381, partial [Gautieria morchelliformis]
PMYYSFYDTVLETLTGSFLPMELHLYMPPGKNLLLDDTVAHIVGHVYAPSSTDVMMDGLSVTPYPGKPSSEDYEVTIPDNKVVAIWVLGAVLNNAETDVETNTRKFNLGVSEYVRDSN